MATRKKQRKTLRTIKKKMADETAKRELDLFIENTGELYPMKQAIIANLQKKRAKGKYDASKAPKAWQYWVDRGAKQYEKEFGGSKAFDKATRTALAEELAKRYERGEDF
jgi:hypothetical protein